MTDSLLTDRRFWRTAVERAVLTCAQTLAAELAVFQLADIRELKLHGLPWYAMISVAVLAALVSVLTTISKGALGNAGAGVALEPEDVAEPFAHDDAPLPPDIVSMQLIAPAVRADKTTVRNATKKPHGRPPGRDNSP